MLSHARASALHYYQSFLFLLLLVKVCPITECRRHQRLLVEEPSSSFSNLVFSPGENESSPLSFLLNGISENNNLTKPDLEQKKGTTMDSAPDSSTNNNNNSSSITLWKRTKQDDYSDIEVILTSNPIISPDIYIGRFVDSKVTIHDTLLEELGLSSTPTPIISPSSKLNEISSGAAASTTKTTTEADVGTNDVAILENLSVVSGSGSGGGGQSVIKSKNTIGGSRANESEISIFTFSSRVPTNEEEERRRLDKFKFLDNVMSYHPGHSGDDIEELSRRAARSQTCYQKFNGTTGRFQLNFTQDCIFLLVSPDPSSRLVLHCENVNLSNCSVNRDALTVNLKGDLRFGRNSYLYCGSNAHVRTTSLRRRISIRVRQDLNVKERTECAFFARKERFYNDEGGDGGSGGGGDGSGINECGRHGRNSKIVGGRSVEPGVFPWVSQLDITRTDGTQTACTGSLITNKYILTAAHCLKNAESISVFLGGTDRLAFTGSEVTVQAEKFILHRSWNPKTLIADLALVKLTESVRFTDEISSVCLPGRRLRRETMTGRMGVAAGWGRLDTAEKAPQQLYRVKLPFLSDTLCFLAYRRFFKRDLMMCTESTLDLGVASYSSSKICGESYDVFTKLGDDYVEWINKRIRESS